jgi:hypothetical protein
VRTTSTCRSSGSSARIGATLRRYKRSVVTSTRTEPSDSRAFTGSGPNAENSGQYTAPAASVPSTVAYKGGTRPISDATRSPRCTPRS